MFVDRGDGTRVRIPNEVEAEGDAAVAAFLANPPQDAIEASEPEPIPGEVITEHREVLALAAQHGLDLKASAVATGPGGCWRLEDIRGLLPKAQEPAAESTPAAAPVKRGRSTPASEES